MGRLGIVLVAVALGVACNTTNAAGTPTSSVVPPGAAADGPGSDAAASPSSDLDAGADVGSDARLDAGTDGDAAPVVLKRFSGHVDFNGPVANAVVTMLAPTSGSTTTDMNGDFFVYAPLGSAVVTKVEAPNLFPMIRGAIVTDPLRIRTFYLAGPPEQQAAQDLGLTIDPTKGIVEVDFRNAQAGGYGVTIKTAAGAVVTPGFGIAFDAMGNPQSSLTTVTGGDGTTLLLGNVPPGTLSFTPISPNGAMACTACDAPTLPVQAGVVTWVDVEAGAANCQ